MKEIKRIFALFGVDGDRPVRPRPRPGTRPTDGEFRMYAGGTTKEDVERALHAQGDHRLPGVLLREDRQVPAREGPGGRRAERAGGRRRHRRAS
ncbi:MAG: hypothetical protein MZW92_59735 [Comamonadaceae bacterium]|nr:hypothetical protein [Comamonadaceae bacterium]